MISICSGFSYKAGAGNYGFTSSRVIIEERDHKDIETWSVESPSDGNIKCILNFATGELKIKATSKNKETKIKAIFIKGRELWKPYVKSVSFEGNITSIEGSYHLEYAFRDCKNLIYIEIPNSVKTIGHRAFSGCESLSSIAIDSVTTIGYRAFAGCKSLFKIEIPNVRHMGMGAFKNCKSLTQITMPGEIKLNNFLIDAEGHVKPVNTKKELFNNLFEGCSSLLYKYIEGLL